MNTIMSRWLVVLLCLALIGSTWSSPSRTEPSSGATSESTSPTPSMSVNPKLSAETCDRMVEAMFKPRAGASFAYSKAGALLALQKQGFSEEMARAALDKANIDWGAQTKQAITQELSMFPLSKARLLAKLARAGFTEADVEAQIKAIPVDFKEQAVLRAKSYLTNGANTRELMMKLLADDQFTADEAAYACDKLSLS